MLTLFVKETNICIKIIFIIAFFGNKVLPLMCDSDSKSCDSIA